MLFIILILGQDLQVAKHVIYVHIDIRTVPISVTYCLITSKTCLYPQQELLIYIQFPGQIETFYCVVLTWYASFEVKSSWAFMARWSDRGKVPLLTLLEYP